jgi:pimeloyl-ACP methyl ester carboxylesterase
MGFHEARGSLIPFAYDWRVDVRTSAAVLRDRLSQPDLHGQRVAIIAHSMGGLVTRYALEKLGIPHDIRVELCAFAGGGAVPSSATGRNERNGGVAGGTGVPSSAKGRNGGGNGEGHRNRSCRQVTMVGDGEDDDEGGECPVDWNFLVSAFQRIFREPQHSAGR